MVGAERGLLRPQAPKVCLLPLEKEARERRMDGQPQRSGLALNSQWWPRGGWRTCGVLGGAQVRVESRPGFVLQASGRRSPESCSKPEKILKRGTYDKVGGSGRVGGTLGLQNWAG